MYTGYLSELELGMLLAPNNTKSNPPTHSVITLNLDWPIADCVTLMHRFQSINALTDYLISFPETSIVIVNCKALDTAELNRLGLILAQYPNISIYVCEHLPSMEFSLADFSFCANENELREQLQQDKINKARLFEQWKQELHTCIYQRHDDPTLAQSIESIGGSYTLLEHDFSAISASSLVILDFNQAGLDISILINQLSELENSPPIVVVYQSDDRFFKHCIALIQHLNLRLALTVTLEDLTTNIEALATTTFQSTQRFLRQYAPMHDQSSQRVYSCKTQQGLASWAAVSLDDLGTIVDEDYYCVCLLDKNLNSIPVEQITRMHQSGSLDLTRMRLVCNYQQLKNGYSPGLLRLLQQGLTLVLLATQIRNMLIEPHWLGVFDQVFVPITLWQRLQTEVIKQDIWRNFSEACSLADVAMGLIDVPQGLANDYAELGFDYIVCRVPNDNDAPSFEVDALELE